MQRLILIPPLLLLLPSTGLATDDGQRSAPAVEWRHGDRVVLLGDAFIERSQAHGYLESLLATAIPAQSIQVRNLGWSGDTVTGIARAVFGSPADGFQRLLRDVQAAEPSVILVAYGANEAFGGEPGVPEFAANLNRLLDALQATGARLVLVSPHRRLAPPPPLPDFQAYNRDLRKYCDVLREAAERRKLPYVDLYDLLDAAAGETARPGTEQLTDNGLHLSHFGYWYVAPLLAERLAIPLPPWEVTLDMQNDQVHAVGTRVDELTQGEGGLKCRLRDESLSYPRFPFGDESVSHPLAPAGTLRVAGLAAGRYRLLLDGRKVTEAGHAEWQAGVGLPHRGDEPRFERLRREITRKNELYFHRYRPQNETYLFLFRKHEQGNNAAEIPQFDPLIAESEERIAELARPLTRTLQLQRVPD